MRDRAGGGVLAPHEVGLEQRVFTLETVVAEAAALLPHGATRSRLLAALPAGYELPDPVRLLRGSSLLDSTTPGCTWCGGRGYTPSFTSDGNGGMVEVSTFGAPICERCHGKKVEL